MTEQTALLTWMIEQEKLDAKSFCVSNHLFDTPRSITLQADEIAFISFIQIEANSSFIFRYSSATESRTIEKTITAARTIENNIVTKHLSSIKFKMSNSDKYQISIVKVKIIK